MKYLLIAVLFLSCKKDKLPTCYSIKSYTVKRIVPMTYEVTAVNKNKTVIYTTSNLPVIGNQKCF